MKRPSPARKQIIHIKVFVYHQDFELLLQMKQIMSIGHVGAAYIWTLSMF